MKVIQTEQKRGTDPAPSAADLRAQVAMRRAVLYRIAPRVGLHPARLGQLLNERLPLSAELAWRIQDAIEHEA